MPMEEGTVVRIAHTYDGVVYMGMGHGKTRGEAREAAIKDLLAVLPTTCRRPLIRVRRAHESQSSPAELWVRFP